MDSSAFYKREYNVLMVDDEYIILKGLEKMIDWKGLNLKLVATASHGEEALSIVNQNDIDIIISDVNMPKLNGIQFIEKIQEMQRSIEFLFVSGYEKFEYIKSGLVLGANDYILKPIDKYELHQALVRIIEKINQRVDEKVMQSQHKILAEWLRDNFSVSNPLSLEKNTFDIYLMIPQMDASIDELWNYYNQSEEWMIIGKNDYVIAVIKIIDQAITIGNVLERMHHLSGENLHRMYHKIRQKFRNFNFYLSKEWNTQSISEYFLTQVEDFDKHQTQTSLSYRIGLIYQALEMNNWRNVQILLKKIKLDLSEVAMNRLEVHQLMQSFINYHIGEDVRLEEYQSIDELIEATSQLLRINSDQVKFDHLHPSIKRALTIIEENYQKDINLKYLADQLHLNVMYLGQLFKKELGQPFSQYLNQWRIDKSKQLLSKTQLTVSQVGIEVGYQNQAYFYRIFKKQEGVSPKEYRQQILNQSF